MVHICKGTFSAVLWPRVVLFSNSPMMTSGTLWPKKWNSHKQRQPNLLPQAFCHGKSVFAGSTLSNRRGSEREVIHHGNSSFCHSEGASCVPPSLGSADQDPQQPEQRDPSCGAWAVFPWEHLPGGAHACLFALPSSRVQAPSSPEKKTTSQSFEVATVALSLKADLQGNKCCQPDPTSGRLKKGWSERDVLRRSWLFFFFFSILLVLYVPIKILSILDDRMADLEM